MISFNLVIFVNMMRMLEQEVLLICYYNWFIHEMIVKINNIDTVSMLKPVMFSSLNGACFFFGFTEFLLLKVEGMCLYDANLNILQVNLSVL